MSFVTFICFKEDIAQVCVFHLAVLVPASFYVELLTQILFIVTFKTNEQPRNQGSSLSLVPTFTLSS